MTGYCMRCMRSLDGTKICPKCGFDGKVQSMPHQLKAGTVLNDRYLAGCVIGQGGFGITYIGRDIRLDMRVAIKEYYPGNYVNRNSEVSSDVTVYDKEQRDFLAEGKKKFLSEAKALAEFHDHAGIVDVRDYFEENNTAYIIMEYLEGEDLRVYLKKSLFSADEIFGLMKPIMNALEEIHAENIIHRDISPDNIMLLKNGTLKLMDFGAARVMDYSDQKSVSVVLKAGYAPEEQYRPKGKQGPWTDVYALSATIYKCITGITPDDSLQRGYDDEIKWPSELGRKISVQQENALKKGLAVRQQDRIQNIADFRKEVWGGEREEEIHTVHFAVEEEENSHAGNEADDDVTMYAGSGTDDDVTVYAGNGTDDDVTVYAGRETDDDTTVHADHEADDDTARHGGNETPEEVMACQESAKPPTYEKKNVEKQKSYETKGKGMWLRNALICVVVCAVLFVAVAGFLLTRGSSAGGETVETSRQMRVPASYTPFLFGNYTVEKNDLDQFLNKMEYEMMEAGEETYEMSVLPCCIRVNPSQRYDDKNVAELEFCDRYGVTYQYCATYSMTESQIRFYPVSQDAYPEAYALADEMTLSYEFKYDKLVISGQDVSATLENEYTATHDGIILQGSAGQEQYDDISSISLYCEDYEEKDSGDCKVIFADGGYASDVAINAIYDNIASVHLNWTEERRPYNGREEIFTEKNSLDFKYINSYPYGFIMIMDDRYYFYQSEVREENGKEGTGSTKGAEGNAQEKGIYVIMMQPSEDMSIGSYDKAVETLKERLDVLANGEDYELKVDGYKISLTIPRAWFDEIDFDIGFDAYVARETKLYGIGEEGFNPDRIVINRTDLESVVMLEGNIDGVDAREYGAEGGYPYLQVTLTDDFLTKNQDKIAEWGDDFHFALDVGGLDYFYFDTFRTEEENSFDLFDDNMEERFVALQLYNLTHDPLPARFEWEVRNPISEYVWESLEDTIYVGAHQCNREDLKGDTVRIFYNIYDDLEDMTSGERLDMEQTLKGRLDALDQPYAVGTYYDDVNDEKGLVFETGLDHMGIAIMESLGADGNNIVLRTGFSQISFSDTECTYQQNPDGTYSLQIAVSEEESKEVLEHFTASALEEGEEEVQLLLRNKQFCKVEIDSAVEDGILIFDSFSWNDEKAVTEEELWMLDYFLAASSSLEQTISYNNYQMQPLGEVELTQDQFGVQTAIKEETLKSRIAGVAPKADVQLRRNGAELSVQLHLEMGGEFLSELARQVEDIYRESGYEENALEELSLYLIDEENEEAERARIFFRKRYVFFYDAPGRSKEKGSVSMSGIFCNGRLDDYQDQYLELLKTNAFFQQFSPDEITFSLDDY